MRPGWPRNTSVPLARGGCRFQTRNAPPSVATYSVTDFTPEPPAGSVATHVSVCVGPSLVTVSVAAGAALSTRNRSGAASSAGAAVSSTRAVVRTRSPVGVSSATRTVYDTNPAPSPRALFGFSRPRAGSRTSSPVVGSMA